MGQNFQADIRIGRQAEDTFIKHLQSKGHFAVQISGNWKWWDIYDFTTKETFEIKNDTLIKTTGNLCLELWSHKKMGSIGWAHYSKADWLIYFISPTEYLKIRMADIKKYIENPKNIKGKRKVSAWSKGNSNVQNVLIEYTVFTNKINNVKIKDTKYKINIGLLDKKNILSKKSICNKKNVAIIKKRNRRVKIKCQKQEPKLKLWIGITQN